MKNNQCGPKTDLQIICSASGEKIKNKFLIKNEWSTHREMWKEFKGYGNSIKQLVILYKK